MQIKKQIIKIILLVAAVVLCSSTSVFALDYFGVPLPKLDPGKFSLGISYAQSSTDLKLTNGSGKLYVNGTYNNSGQVDELTISDFDVTNIRAEIGYGLDYNWELFVLLGSSSSQFDNDQLGTNFDSGAAPSIGAGIKTSLYEEYDFRVGVVAQVNWFNYSSKFDFPGIGIPEAQIDIMEFYNTTKGDFNYLFDTVDEEGSVNSLDFTFDAETTSSFGAFLGCEYLLDKNTSLTAEFQTGSGGILFGAGVVIRF